MVKLLQKLVQKLLQKLVQKLLQKLQKLLQKKNVIQIIWCVYKTSKTSKRKIISFSNSFSSISAWINICFFKKTSDNNIAMLRQQVLYCLTMNTLSRHTSSRACKCFFSRGTNFLSWGGSVKNDSNWNWKNIQENIEPLNYWKQQFLT